MCDQPCGLMTITKLVDVTVTLRDELSKTRQSLSEVHSTPVYMCLFILALIVLVANTILVAMLLRTVYDGIRRGGFFELRATAASVN
jgi:hypothetical protein